MSFCLKCGAELEENSKFCASCGTPVSSEVSTPAETEGVSPKKKLPAFLTAILVGNVGVNDFYLGHIGRGVFKAIFTVLGYIFYAIGIGCCFGIENSYGTEETVLLIVGIFSLVNAVIFLLVPSIMALVDWIKTLCNKTVDKNGLIVKNWV